jgi:hypothetical protein
MKKVLNIGAGKIPPLDLPDERILINLDRSYYRSDNVAEIESFCEVAETNPATFYIQEDIFEFMERTSMKFDRIACYRFLEHVPRDKVDYFMYLLAQSTMNGGIVDIIVPDYKILCKKFLEENIFQQAREYVDYWDRILTYEILADPACPHASLWSSDRLS